MDGDGGPDAGGLRPVTPICASGRPVKRWSESLTVLFLRGRLYIVFGRLGDDSLGTLTYLTSL